MIITFLLSAANFTLGFVENVTVEQWSNILNVNVVGYALMVKYVVPWMKKQRSGSIIQFGSISGLIAQPGFVPYSTTKGAVMQMTKNLALDLGPHNIRCNSVAPGCIGKRRNIRFYFEPNVRIFF